MSVEKFLACSGLSRDYLFHLAELSDFLPTYQTKVRAFTALKEYLAKFRTNLSKEYFLKINSIYNPAHYYMAKEHYHRFWLLQTQLDDIYVS